MDDSMFPGPQPGPYGQGAPRPPRHGFFDSVRASGWYRPENRTIGGVCAAISARTGWDLVLVRGVVLVALVFGAPLLAVYGAAWALLPEQRDGRIHAEEFLAGRFDAAQFGAGLLVLLGLTSIFPMSATLSSGSTFSWFASIAALGVIAAVVVLALSGRSRIDEVARASAGRVPPSGPLGSTWSSGAHQPPPHGAPAQAGSPWASHPASGAGSPAPGAAPSTPFPAFGAGAPRPEDSRRPAHAPQPRPQAYAAPARPSDHAPMNGWIPPVLVERRSVSRRANLAVTGLVLLAMAATFWAMYRFMRDGSTDGGVMGVRLGLIGGGICLLIVGVALVIASLRGRGAAWLVALSVIGCVLAMPTALVGASYQSYGSTSGLDFSQGPSYFDWSATTLTADSSGSAQLDLTGAPEGTTTTITVGYSVTDLTISARQDQPVRIVCSSGISDVVASYWTGSPESESSDWVSRLRTCESADGGADVVARSSTWSADNGITIRVESWLNSLYFSEDMAASTGGAQSSDEGAAGAPQSSGAGASGSPGSGAQSGSSSDSTADGSASAHQTAHSATASTATALFALPLLDADRRLS